MPRLHSLSPADAPVGTLIDGKYRVERLLSRGGAGAVFVARHVHLGTEVALKLLHDHARDGGDASARDLRTRRFLREARLAAQLTHPNLVQILDCGLVDDVPYLVMELIPGTDLRARLAAAPLTLVETCALIDGIAAGLTVAHVAGIVHRDLKPDNVVLDTRATPPRPRVVDFGLATLTPTAARDASGSSLPPMAGTPAYLAPTGRRRR